MRCRLTIAILLLAFVGCKDQGSIPPDWLAPYEQWRSYGLVNYTIDQSRVCFCIDGGQTMRLAIRSGTIASVTRLSDTTQISSPTFRWYLTVDSMFAIVRNPGSDSILVTYNALYGYPEHLDINPQLHPVDGGVIYQTSNLQIP